MVGGLPAFAAAAMTSAFQSAKPVITAALVLSLSLLFNWAAVSGYQPSSCPAMYYPSSCFQHQ